MIKVSILQEDTIFMNIYVANNTPQTRNTKDFLNLIKDTQEPFTASITLDGKTLNGFTLKSVTGQGSPFLTLPSSIA